jgi:glycosyltransferase involved in cell wall biosynthesis
MKVLHLISSAGMYGAENMLLNLALAQAQFGCEPILGIFINERKPQMGITEAARRRGLSVETFFCRGRIDHRAISTIRTFISNQNIELVHSHGYKSNFYGCLAAKPLSVPLVSTCHLWTRATLSVRIYEWLDSLTLRSVQRVVAVSDVIADLLQKSGVPKLRIATIYNGTDVALFEGALPNLRLELNAGNRPLIGTVARLEEQKGLRYFIEAARDVISKLPEALFVIVGEGSERAKLTELIREHRLEHNILLLGSLENMPGVYASLDIFVLASINEGMPMTILEALGAARPVIATRVGSVEQLILQDETGILIEPRDVSALSTAILRLLYDRPLARTLAAAGAARVKRHFTAGSMASKYVEIYRQVLSEKGSAFATRSNRETIQISADRNTTQYADRGTVERK